MSKDTTTTTEQESVQAPEAQPEEPETQAVQAKEVSETSEADTTNQTEVSEEDELKEWAEKKGIKTDDTAALLKMARESEKKMHEATQEAKALKSTVETVGEEQGFDETGQLINRLKVTEFYLNNPEAKQLDKQMAEIVTAKPYLAEDLETVYELAKARSGPADNMTAKQLGQKEALAQVAKAEKAAPPQASATTREGYSEKTRDEILDLPLKEYAQYKKEHPEFNPFA